MTRWLLKTVAADGAAPRYPRKFYELQLTQDQSNLIEVNGLADDNVSKELQELSRLQGKYGYRMTRSY